MIDAQTSVALQQDFNLSKIREIPNYFVGAIDETRVSRQGGRFSGWAVQKDTKSPAPLFLVKSDDGQVVLIPPNRDRPDISRKMGPSSLPCGVAENIPLGIIGSIFVPRLSYYAFDGSDIMTPLPVLAQSDKLAVTTIANAKEFFLHVQTPSTRIKDPEALSHLSVHALRRTGNDFNLGAAAACVAGYRLLEEVRSILYARSFINEKIDRLLDCTPGRHRGLYIRWHTSLRLVAGYLAYQAGHDDDALLHFDKIADFSSELKEWPQALTNILISVAICGHICHSNNNISLAIDRWSRAEAILRYGASIAQFQNYYAYGELINATKVARFCHIAVLSAARGGELNDVSIAPLGTKIDLRDIPGPIGALHQKRSKKTNSQ